MTRQPRRRQRNGQRYENNSTIELPALLGNLTDRQTDQPTDQQMDMRHQGKLHFQKH